VQSRRPKRQPNHLWPQPRSHPHPAAAGRWPPAWRSRGASLYDGATKGLQTIGRFFELGAQAFVYLITDIVRLRHPWRDTLSQASFIVGVTAIPAMLISIPFGVIIAVCRWATSSSRWARHRSPARSAASVSSVRPRRSWRHCCWAARASSAMTTDLVLAPFATRVDALRVMGIDPVQRLVTPRLAAILLLAPLLCMFLIFMGLSAGYFVNVAYQGGTPGSYIASFGSYATVGDVVVALLKTWLFGVIVTVIACQARVGDQKGRPARRGRCGQRGRRSRRGQRVRSQPDHHRARHHVHADEGGLMAATSRHIPHD